MRGSSSLNPNAYRPPSKVPLSSTAAPVPPLTAIADPRNQAMYTTYPARMRLGTSSLMQPNYLAATGTGTNTPGGGSSKRGRTAINYAEIEGLEDSDDDSNDSEAKLGKRSNLSGGLTPKRLLGVQPVGEKAVWGDGKSYLNVLPPGNLVVVQLARVTKHRAL
jgi:chromatin structure-remodeling complex subunit SFH1